MSPSWDAGSLDADRRLASERRSGNKQGSRDERNARRRGLVLVVVLVVVVMLALTAYTFNDLMLAYRESAMAAGDGVQGRLLVESGIEYLRLALATSSSRSADKFLLSSHLRDDPSRFDRIPVVPADDDQPAGGNFSAVTPRVDGEGRSDGVRHGLQDDSARLNLELLLAADRHVPGSGRAWLLRLPGMTEDVADAILDWMDADDDPRPRGAERQFYNDLRPPYEPANRPPRDVGELLLVRGVTPELLFGWGPAGAWQNARPGQAGWAEYLTTYSEELHFPPGDQRINVNQPDLSQLSRELRQRVGREWEMFIVAYRQNGPSKRDSTLLSATSRELDLTQPPRYPIHQLLDLFDARVQVTLLGDSEPIVLQSPLSSDSDLKSLVPLVFDNLTVTTARTIPGRLNVLEAPETLIAGLPGLDAAATDRLLHWRNAKRDERQPPRHTTDLLREGVLDVRQMRSVYPLINLGGNVFRTHVIAELKGRPCRQAAEVVLSRGPVSRVLSCRFYETRHSREAQQKGG